MSITVKLKEVANPKFCWGDVVRGKDGSIEPFEVTKVEISRYGIKYYRADGSPFFEEHLELHEEELTFGDVPVGSGFIDKDGDFCIKVYNYEGIDNAFVRKNNGAPLLFPFRNSEPIKRIIPNIEIREVEP